MPPANAALTQLRILHGALAGSVLIYGVIVFLAVVKADPQPPEPENAKTLVIIMGAVAASVMGAIPVIRSKVMPRPPAQGSGGAAPGVFPGAGGGGVDLTRSTPDRQKLLTGSILTWAMCESIAISGVMSAFITHRGWPFPIFAAVSLVNFAIYRPR